MNGTYQYNMMYDESETCPNSVFRFESTRARAAEDEYNLAKGFCVNDMTKDQREILCIYMNWAGADMGLGHCHDRKYRKTSKSATLLYTNTYT
jgi:hypothetical protein